jgi:cytochrome c5
MLPKVLALGVLLSVTSVSARQQPEQEKAAEEKTQAAASQDVVLPAGEGRDVVSKECSRCHAVGVVTRHGEDEARWKRYLDDMIVRGAQLTPDESKSVLQYLTKHFGPPSSTTSSTTPAKTEPASAAEDEGKTLVDVKCSVCHDVERVGRVYRNASGWAALIDNMVSRGAVLTPDEARKIRAYLFAHYGIP